MEIINSVFVRVRILLGRALIRGSALLQDRSVLSLVYRLLDVVKKGILLLLKHLDSLLKKLGSICGSINCEFASWLVRLTLAHFGAL